MSEHELWNELGNLYFISGAYPEAVDAYYRSIQLDGESGRPYSSLALTYVKQGEYEKAVDLYKKSIALSVDDMEKVSLWNQLGNVYVQLKDYQEAMLSYQIADEFEEKSAENNQAVDFVNPVVSDELIAEAADYSSGEELDEVMLPRSKDPNEPFVSDAVTVSRIAEDIAEYQRDFSAVSESASTETWTDAGNDWEMELNPALDQDVEVFFPEPEANSLAGWLPIPEVESFEHAGFQDYEQNDLDQNEDESALQDQGAQALELTQDAPVMAGRKYEFNEQFSLRVELNMDEKPAAAFGIAQKPNDQKSAAQIEYERKNFDDQIFENRDEEINEIKNEISKFKRVVQINPRNATAWDTLGTLYKSAGMYKDAILAYQQAISTDPSKGFYHHHLALVFAVEGRNEDAIMAYQKVIEIDPDHSLANAALGGYYRKMGLEELAQKHIGKAMKNIYNSESEYNQACLEAICGNSDQAIELLRIALEEKQTYVNWVMHDPDLDAIRELPGFKQLISDFIK